VRAVLAWIRLPGRALALTLLLVAVVIYAAQPYLLREQRGRGFDAMQRIWPRHAAAPGVLIVDVDEKSLKELGQWPWPRLLLARLVERIAASKPLVLGIDIVFAEPDRLSPPEIPSSVPGLPAPVVAALSALPSSDATLAEKIASVPTVLGVFPVDEDVTNSAGPHRAAPILQKGGSSAPFLIAHRAMLRSLPEIVRAARSEASLGVEPDDDGTVRSVPAAMVIGGNLVPSLAVEMLRVGARIPAITITTGHDGIGNLQLGSLSIPTDERGNAYLHFAYPVDQDISAVDVLKPDFDPRRLEGRIVLLAVTGLGLLDQKQTPLGPMQGATIHAQLIESMLAGTLLHRSRIARWAELGLILAAGAIVIAGLRYTRPWITGLGLAGVVMALIGSELGLFVFTGWLVDSLFAAETAILTFGVMLGGNFVAEQRERRRIAAQLELKRQAEARLDGEFAAARAIQMGILPLHFPAFRDRHDIDLYARIEPARDVGGDLFDFQLIDDTKLFFMIGDVSGKGIPAALFMAMTKEVIRDATARRDAIPDLVLGEANAKIGEASVNLAEGGANMMFVTAFAGLLDLGSGELVYASAGHDSPLVVGAGRKPRALLTAGGPPLGTADDFRFPLSRDRLENGETLLLYTDGVTEAQNAGGALYLSRRLVDCLASLSFNNAKAVIDAVFDDVSHFAAGAEQADDIALLGVRRVA